MDVQPAFTEGNGGQMFVGYIGSECQISHNSTGRRAWCDYCTEWCYHDAPCVRCEMAILRQVLGRDYLDDVIESYVKNVTGTG